MNEGQHGMHEECSGVPEPQDDRAPLRQGGPESETKSPEFAEVYETGPYSRAIERACGRAREGTHTAPARGSEAPAARDRHRGGARCDRAHVGFDDRIYVETYRLNAIDVLRRARVAGRSAIGGPGGA